MYCQDPANMKFLPTSVADLRSIEVFRKQCRLSLCLQQRRPNLHALIVGADVVAYGAGGMMVEVGEIGPSRICL